MKSVFIIWDERDLFDLTNIFADKKSADFALLLKYTEYWITNGKAKVIEKKLISFGGVVGS